ncbi:MAG: Ribosome recycling factor [uncultured Acidimicrobiales bacterium]|uniref:Ribosome-recycling factor n=1 Tax=uncultured Acidimicrobiales bacterium TaxID=310071 RepID=A0A6J4IZ88_9ACTN|nr:MAG: Ribosome recycling factor [uncultured Acidimicrobiales bacterium]
MSAASEVVGMVLDDTRDKMVKAVDHTSAELATIRTGRATPSLVEKLKVEYYGASTPLQQIAGIAAPEPRLLVISPYDKTSMKAIEKAIQESDLGINPQNDGTVIRLAIPALTEERRKDLAKQAKHKAEEGRIAVRNLRRQARHELDAFEKDGEVGTDEVERAERDLDKLTSDQVAKIDLMLQHKEADLMQV